MILVPYTQYVTRITLLVFFFELLRIYIIFPILSFILKVVGKNTKLTLSRLFYCFNKPRRGKEKVRYENRRKKIQAITWAQVFLPQSPFFRFPCFFLNLFFFSSIHTFIIIVMIFFWKYSPNQTKKWTTKEILVLLIILGWEKNSLFFLFF